MWQLESEATKACSGSGRLAPSTTGTGGKHAYTDKGMGDREPVRYSIVVPSWNEEATIASVLAAVRPMTDDLLVVDGGSTDRTVEIAHSYQARIVQDHGGSIKLDSGAGGPTKVHINLPVAS